MAYRGILRHGIILRALGGLVENSYSGCWSHSIGCRNILTKLCGIQNRCAERIWGEWQEIL